MATFRSFDAEAFRAFEHAGWQDVAANYDKAFAQLTSQTAESLLDAAEVREGTRVLDIAAGPGYTAGAAAQRAARVIAIDFSGAAVAVARQNYPLIDFREGDAEALSFADNSFDAVIMNFGLLHLSRPEQALREAYRVLSPGGRVGLTVWSRPSEAVGFDILNKAIQTYGNPHVSVPEGPSFFRFSDHEELNNILLAVGFTLPEISPLPLVWKLPSPDALFHIQYTATVRNKAILCAQSPEDLRAIQQAVRKACQRYERAGIVKIPMSAVLASARK